MEKKKELSFYTKYLAEKGLITGSEGNLSVRDKEGFWITPSGKIKEILEPKDLCFINWQGEFLKGKPSSEWGMHYKIYLKNPQAKAIVHAHPAYVLALDLCGFDFREFDLPEAKIFLKEIKVVPFFLPGSEELWEKASESALISKVIVLSQHGALTWGRNLEEAVNLLLILEKLCKIEYLRRLGGQR
ncbi:class II aldolase/adducin family protein [Thermodesulfobacterium hydrogeniphilum]|uniref:class II aldolase/adducin family protein n=1 Tax=Thermodesulfobacterium hydrogeniphilum TaxID=161156 RepID=UPI0005705C01|nr:class II aldolase/adducin family protein [Thermodesulfobacterium hydrogeniphilum]